MKYKGTEIISDLYSTSMSKRGGHLLEKNAETKIVYDLDLVKDKYCEYYRHSEKIKSCDAYYYDTNKNHLIMEFKNTHHLKFKSFYDELEIKLLDTHMLCRENFWRSKKLNYILEHVNVAIVYNDALNNGVGVNTIANALCKMKPIQGDIKRNTQVVEQFTDESEFQKKVKNTKDKFEKEFYHEIEFIDKKEFEERYIETGYFSELEIWSEIE